MNVKFEIASLVLLYDLTSVTLTKNRFLKFT